MSLTLFDINVLTDKQDKKTLMLESRVHFDQQCVVNEPNTISLFNIFWITNGCARIVIDFNGFDVKPGTLFFLLPGQVFTVLSEQKITGYRLAFARDFYFINTLHPEIGCSGILFNTFKFGPVIRLNKNELEELKKIMTSLQESIQSEGLANSEKVQSYLKIFLIQCAQAKRRQLDELPDNRFSSLEELSEINTVIENHFREWHSVKEYAGYMNLSPKSLAKKLSRYGQSPSRLIHDRIILEAKRMMHYTQKSIKEIATELGFDDPYHFSKFFKSHTSVSPRKFMSSVVLQ